MYVWVPHACSAHRGQKGEVDPLELGLKVWAAVWELGVSLGLLEESLMLSMVELLLLPSAHSVSCGAKNLNSRSAC